MSINCIHVNLPSLCTFPHLASMYVCMYVCVCVSKIRYDPRWHCIHTGWNVPWYMWWTPNIVIVCSFHVRKDPLPSSGIMYVCMSICFIHDSWTLFSNVVVGPLFLFFINIYFLFFIFIVVWEGVEEHLSISTTCCDSWQENVKMNHFGCHHGVSRWGFWTKSIKCMHISCYEL